MRRVLLGGVVFLLGCGGMTPASELARAPAFEPEGQTKCSVAQSQDKPLIVEWPAADRGALEAQMSKGLVAVRYQGCEMEVLRRCQGGTRYGYTPVTPKQEHVSIRTADELYAAIPVHAAKFEGKLETAGQLDVDMTLVGSWEAGVDAVTRDAFSGDCGDATHFVHAITAGAFEFAASGGASVGAGASVGGLGAGAESQAERELLNRDGYEKACDEATLDDEAPPDGCGALLRLEVVPFEQARPEPSAVDNALPVADAFSPTGAADEEGVVKVHLESEELVQLVQFGAVVPTQVPMATQQGTVMTTQMLPQQQLVCVSPCDRWVDARPGQQFFVSGDDIMPSDPFRLHDRRGEVTVKVDPGSSGGKFGGLGLIITGATLAPLGAMMIGLGALFGDESVSGDDGVSTQTGFYVGGGIGLGVGLLLIGGGIPLMVLNDTEVEIATRAWVPQVGARGLKWTF